MYEMQFKIKQREIIMIVYKYKFTDNSNELNLVVEIVKTESFNNDFIPINDSNKNILEIYKMLSYANYPSVTDSDNHELIQDYLSDLIQDDDSPYKRGEN